MKHNCVILIWPFYMCTCLCVRFSPTLRGYFRCPRNTDVPMYCFKPPGRLQEGYIFLTYATFMILHYFNSHALFWCSPKIPFFFCSFPHLLLHSSSYFWAPGGGLLENEMINSGKPSACYLISVSHSGFTHKCYYWSCIFKFFFTKTKKQTMNLQLNSINHEERRFLKPLDFCKKAKLVSHHLDFTGFGNFT